MASVLAMRSMVESRFESEAAWNWARPLRFSQNTNWLDTLRSEGFLPCISFEISRIFFNRTFPFLAAHGVTRGFSDSLNKSLKYFQTGTAVIPGGMIEIP
jgi:hypothetical protein